MDNARAAVAAPSEPGRAAFWMTAYVGLLALAFFLRFRGGRWRYLQLTEPQLDEDSGNDGSGATTLART